MRVFAVASLLTRPLRPPTLVRAGVSALVGVIVATAAGARELPRGPDELYGELFAEVQRARCFADQKTFADAVPKSSVPAVLAAYRHAAQTASPVDVCGFAREHFLLPEIPQLSSVPGTENLAQHVRQLWPLLTRAPDRAVPGSSLLPLPRPYIVPGGRFREIYYWDSYFTMLGLRASGEEELIASMVDNFAYLLRTFGHIPNGNRTYYLTRSQPPFFALMVELLAEREGPAVYTRYLDALRAEHAYWNDATGATRHRVLLPDGSALTRYYDRANAPRPEAFVEDEAVFRRVGGKRPELYREIRSACESGWDFSTRWFGDGKTLATIRTLELVPVDLNCLLYELERTLARACRETGAGGDARRFEAAATARKEAILRACWSRGRQFFCDYDLATNEPADALTLAGLFPLFCGIATPEQAKAVAHAIETRFLRPGGVVTTLVSSGQQWDAPNGWAPLQWITIRGLENYGHRALAAEIARRWLKLNREVFARTGRMMEKYNVENVALEAGGGEYPGQDGFGWTNGVFLALLAEPRATL